MTELHHGAASRAPGDLPPIGQAIRAGLIAPAPPNHDQILSSVPRFSRRIRLLLLIAAGGGFWALIAVAFLTLR